MSRPKRPPPLYPAGEAYRLAMEALNKGDEAKARELLPHMLESDQGLVRKRLEKLSPHRA